MGSFCRCTSLYNILRTSRKHVSFKTLPPLATRYGKFLYMCQHEIHTEHKTEDKIMQNDKLKGEQPIFIEEAVPHDVLISKLLKCSSLADQMITLSSTLALSPEDIKQRDSICLMVWDMLSPFFYDFKIQMYGSSVNTFGFKGCDIDMSLRTSVEDKEVMTSVHDDCYIPSINDILIGKVSPSYMSRLSLKDQLLFIHTVFLDYYKESSIAPMFINAYIPIIRFYHDRYQLKVDLSAGNGAAIVNTKLLHLYSKLDDRVVPLIMTIRYWAKHFGLIGGGLMFNTYCLTLLGIYYLQTRNPPILPTTEYILSLSKDLLITDITDHSFLNVISQIPPSRNTENLGELLREFFFYYFFFNFDQVICPLIGKSLSRDKFSDAEYSKKFRFNTICIQDPIKLVHNVANLVDYKHCRKFAKEMLYASRLFQEKDVWLPNSELWGLAALLNRFELPVKKSEELQITIPLNSFKDKAQSSSENAVLLQKAHSVLKVLQEVLLFQCEVQEINSEDCDSQTFKEGDTKFLLTCKCLGQNNTWLGRNNVNTEDISSDVLNDPLGFEKAISLKLCNEKLDTKKCDFRFNGRFYGTKCNSELILLIKVTSGNKTVMNPIIGLFLKEYLQKNASKLL